MKRAFQVVFAISVLSGVVWLFWLTGNWLLSVLRDMDADSRGATLALVGVIAVPLISFATQYWLSKKSSREQAIREKRNEFYESVIELFMNMMNSSKKSNVDSNGAVAEWVDKMRALTPQMILYGSTDFVKAWNTFRQISSLNSSDSGFNQKAIHLMIASMEQMMLAARRNLGHRVKSIEQGEYAATFINDLDRAQIRKAYQQLNGGRLKV